MPGKVLLLIDACRPGLVGPGGSATNPDAKSLGDTLNMENVTVLTSTNKDGVSEGLPEWRHGVLSQAFLDALSGAADAHLHCIGTERSSLHGVDNST